VKTITVALGDDLSSTAHAAGTTRGAGSHYEVRVGHDLLGSVAAATDGYSKVLLLSDENVAPLYAGRLGLDDAARCVVAAGEASKSFRTLEAVLDAAAEAGLDRDGVIVALGGGVVGDLGGLAASLYMRGIACVQVPTTLLAQVDSSVGGKTAVNLRAGKNLAGTFHPPALVVADTATLATLSADEFRSGLGEVVKTALIDGEGALAALERDASALVARDPDLLADVVARCVVTKAAIVARDPRESGERKILNLGHTFAHAIERSAGYGRVPHGIAVGVGVALAARTSRAIGVLEDTGLERRIERLLRALDLPHGLDELRATYALTLAARDLGDAMRLDKKNRVGAIRLVLPVAVGKVVLDVEVAKQELVDLLR
jgi:3-dehydroquinate synthase